MKQTAKIIHNVTTYESDTQLSNYRKPHSPSDNHDLQPCRHRKHNLKAPRKFNGFLSIGLDPTKIT